MLSFMPIMFTTPIVLSALALLPGLWWLLRATPPAPLLVRFPAIRLLYGLAPREQTAAHTPWWLLLLRMTLAALLILGFAGPIWHPGAALDGSGPIVLIVDDGWASARDWPARQQAMRDLVTRAGRADRRVVILPTAPTGSREQVAEAPMTPLTATAALAAIDGLRPSPWAVDRSGAAWAVSRLPMPETTTVFWISDGLAARGTDALASALKYCGPVHVLGPSPSQLPVVIAPVIEMGTDLAVTVTRPIANGPRSIILKVTDSQGTQLAHIAASFGADESQIQTPLPMPIELRNQAMRIDLVGEETAASVALLDSAARIPTIGVVGPVETTSAEPLLSARYYIDRALAPFGDLRRGNVVSLLQRPLSLAILTDDDVVSPDDVTKLSDWIDAGGVLLRFSGPGLAAQGDAPLLPVSLRQGDRAIGGAMSWETPAHLAPFAAESPFHGLDIPADVTVSEQVLAEPAPDLGPKTWARLTDGTPLVTAAPHGRGWIVLFHTTANADWSNLALSGLFVDMLRRVADLGARGTIPPSGSLAPWQSLDGFGVLTTPPVSAAPLDATQIATTIPGPNHPPGYYGPPDHASALNLGPMIGSLNPLDVPFDTGPYDLSRETSLAGSFLGAALILLIIDIIVGYGLRGLLRWSIVGLLALLLPTAPGFAASDDSRLIDATGTIHLAYVATGDAEVDAIAKAGLAGLSAQLARRTAVVPGEPMAIDLDHDDLIIFPMIYWPITDSQSPPSADAVARINQYLATGGVLLVDTRDQGSVGAGDPARLNRLLAGVRVPPLEPIPADHVLTRSFYLLHDFPGRWDGGTLWVEPPDAHINDGVSTLIVGADDWAAAWAVDGDGIPEFTPEPDGETQREMAYRFGINLVMYALTGNYKADQIHVRTILDRLGQ